MCYESKDVYIDESSIKNLFLKKSKVNIHNIFFGLCVSEKYNNIKIEFHRQYDKGFVYFTRYMGYKGGRTVTSCMKEMIRFLTKDWGVCGFGHFVVCIE